MDEHALVSEQEQRNELAYDLARLGTSWRTHVLPSGSAKSAKDW